MGCSTSAQRESCDPALTPSAIGEAARLCSEAAGFAEREANAQALALSGSPKAQAPPCTSPTDSACCTIAGLLLATPRASSLHSWETFPGAAFVRVEEAPAYYKEVLLPFYRQLSMPSLLERKFSGGLKVVNRYGRAGLLAVIGDQACHGAFLLMPNPGYHDTVTRAVRAVMKGRGTQQELQVAVAAAEAEGSLAAPSFSGGYAYIAWWVPPTHVLPVRALVDTLRREGEEIRSGTCPFGDSGSPGLLQSVGTLVQDLEKGSARGEGYLHTLRDLTPADAPLLSLLLSEGSSFLSCAAGQKPSTMAFHYPYQKSALGCWRCLLDGELASLFTTPPPPPFPLAQCTALCTCTFTLQCTLTPPRGQAGVSFMYLRYCRTCKRAPRWLMYRAAIGGGRMSVRWTFSVSWLGQEFMRPAQTPCTLPSIIIICGDWTRPVPFFCQDLSRALVPRYCAAGHLASSGTWPAASHWQRRPA